MSKQKTLFFIGAHPDDETFGLGAVIAHYTTAGVKVYYLCSTRGEAGDAYPQYMQGFKTPGDMRWAEMTKAAEVLKLAGLIHLGYRDSGMPGTPDNKNPGALIMAPVDEVAGRIVKIIRELKPDVVITHDAGGGYGHPDHIATHNATVKAFEAAGDPKQYPEAGPAFQPKKLYFNIRPHSLMRVMIKLMPLFGQNPHQFGRNKDIDLTIMAKMDYPVHATVRLNKRDAEVQRAAAACHASQGGGQPPRRGMGIFGLMNTVYGIRNFFCGRRDYFMRAYPPPGKRREPDLFAGIE